MAVSVPTSNVYDVSDSVPTDAASIEVAEATLDPAIAPSTTGPIPTGSAANVGLGADPTATSQQTEPTAPAAPQNIPFVSLSGLSETSQQSNAPLGPLQAQSWRLDGIAKQTASTSSGRAPTGDAITARVVARAYAMAAGQPLSVADPGLNRSNISSTTSAAPSASVTSPQPTVSAGTQVTQAAAAASAASATPPQSISSTSGAAPTTENLAATTQGSAASADTATSLAGRRTKDVTATAPEPATTAAAVSPNPNNILPLLSLPPVTGDAAMSANAAPGAMTVASSDLAATSGATNRAAPAAPASTDHDSTGGSVLEATGGANAAANLALGALSASSLFQPVLTQPVGSPSGSSPAITPDDQTGLSVTTQVAQSQTASTIAMPAMAASLATTAPTNVSTVAVTSVNAAFAVSPATLAPSPVPIGPQRASVRAADAVVNAVTPGSAMPAIVVDALAGQVGGGSAPSPAINIAAVAMPISATAAEPTPEASTPSDTPTPAVALSTSQSSATGSGTPMSAMLASSMPPVLPTSVLPVPAPAAIAQESGAPPATTASPPSSGQSQSGTPEAASGATSSSTSQAAATPPASAPEAAILTSGTQLTAISAQVPPIASAQRPFGGATGPVAPAIPATNVASNSQGSPTQIISAAASLPAAPIITIHDTSGAGSATNASTPHAGSLRPPATNRGSGFASAIAGSPSSSGAPTSAAGALSTPNSTAPATNSASQVSAEGISPGAISLVATSANVVGNTPGATQAGNLGNPNIAANAADIGSDNGIVLSDAIASPVAQIASALVAFTTSGAANVVTVQLQPEDLGKVQISITSDAAGRSNVQVSAERQETLSLLQNDQPALSRALDQAGIASTGRSVSFQLSGESAAAAGANTAIGANGSDFTHGPGTLPNTTNTESATSQGSAASGAPSLGNGSAQTSVSTAESGLATSASFQAGGATAGGSGFQSPNQGSNANAMTQMLGFGQGGGSGGSNGQSHNPSDTSEMLTDDVEDAPKGSWTDWMRSGLDITA